MEQYISAFVFFGFGAITIVGFFVLNWLLAPKRRKENLIEGLGSFIAYECGEIPIGDAHNRFNFQYYVFALIFVIFDVVTAFLLVWALVIKKEEVGLQGLATATIFLGILLVGFLYWWKRNALRWM
ncbi:MAG: NADH-quinone oxidoreductase subunit A [Candidatus Heimdallarchaeota archaeon]|nr:NADH-quinone oxidoreductase subunit A [Candidatus Heimdallarchaeota archaeon]